VQAIERTAPSYRRFARSLQGASIANSIDGIRIGGRLQLMQAKQFVACRDALG
jgi:hypothetical protein